MVVEGAECPDDLGRIVHVVVARLRSPGTVERGQPPRDVEF